VDVEVKAGDLVLGDARLLHAAHANNSDRRRTLITMWWVVWPVLDDSQSHRHIHTHNR
jgi:ectoine hydroxylase-related dioxygenase (phytanoyl-CoA dioxygenase family)